MREHGDRVDEVERLELERLEIRLRVERVHPELRPAELDALLDHVASPDTVRRHALDEEADHAPVPAAEVEPALDVLEAPAAGREAGFDVRDDVAGPLGV